MNWDECGAGMAAGGSRWGLCPLGDSPTLPQKAREGWGNPNDKHDEAGPAGCPRCREPVLRAHRGEKRRGNQVDFHSLSPAAMREVNPVFAVPLWPELYKTFHVEHNSILQAIFLSCHSEEQRDEESAVTHKQMERQKRSRIRRR